MAGRGLGSTANYRYVAYVRARCVRAVIQDRSGCSFARDLDFDSFRGRVDFETGEVLSDTIRRSSSRRRSVISDYCAHNGLGYLLTATFDNAHLPASVAGCFSRYRLFLQRVRYHFGSDFPCVAVVERGAKKGRLHLHVGVGRWYFDNDFVSGCALCSLPGYFVDPATAGRPCLGCLWGNGFVYGPQDSYRGEERANGSMARCAGYLSKYLGKDLGEDLPEFKNAYRVARGFQVPVLKIPADDLESLKARVFQILSPGSSSPLREFVMHEEIEGFPGRPTWLINGDLPLLPAVL